MTKLKFRGKHVLITGGSTGIGLALAKAFLAQGACITLVARTQSKLEEAVQQLQRQAAGAGPQEGLAQTIRYEVADVTAPEQVQKAVQSAQEAQGPVDVLVCNAGSAVMGYFHELDTSAFETCMRLNFFGVLTTVKAVYADMVRRRSGHICLVSSVMGSTGFVGGAAYAPSKYAVKGLADCLRNELQGSGVTVSISYPPDTNTPGYEHENLTKPEETKKISELGGLFQPDKVAQGIVNGIAAGRYTLYGPDLGLNLQVNMMQGIMPRSVLSTLLAMPAGFIAPLLQAGYGWLLDRIARKGAESRFASLRPQG